MSLSIAEDWSFELSRFSLRVRLPSQCPTPAVPFVFKILYCDSGQLQLTSLTLKFQVTPSGAAHSPHTGATCFVPGGCRDQQCLLTLQAMREATRANATSDRHGLFSITITNAISFI